MEWSICVAWLTSGLPACLLPRRCFRRDVTTEETIAYSKSLKHTHTLALLAACKSLILDAKVHSQSICSVGVHEREKGRCSRRHAT